MTSPSGRRGKSRLKRQVPESDDDYEVLIPRAAVRMTRSKRSASKSNGRLKTGESKKGNDSVVECTPAPQPGAQSIDRFEDGVNRGSNKSMTDDREVLLESVENIISSFWKARPSSERARLLREGLSNVLAIQEDGHNHDVEELNQIHLREIANCKNDNNSLREDNEALRKDLEKVNVAGMTFFEILLETNEALRKGLEKVNVAGMKFFEVLQETGKESFKNGLKDPEATTDSDHHAKDDHRSDYSNVTQQIRQINLCENPALTSELHKRSHEPESSKKLKVREANGDDNVRSGSYRDGSATPNLLQMAFSSTRVAVKKFQKLLFKGVKLRQLEEAADSLDIFFAGEKHLAQYVKSLVYANLFEGFESESFNLLSNDASSSLLSDPSLRQANCFKYYLHQREREQEQGVRYIEDPQFEEFYKAKYSLLWRMTVQETSLISFFNFDIPDPKSTFIAAAKTVWLLHKLAFSFDPPVSISRVEAGVNMDDRFMDWGIVKPEDNEQFTSKVGFMIAPGMVLRKKIAIKCEVYPATSGKREN